MIALNEGGVRLAQYRAVLFRSDLGQTVPWLLLILAAALVLGVLLSIRSGFGAGALQQDRR